jgi:lipoate-protein ligase A
MPSLAHPWRFLDTGARPGAFNMEFDEMLARSLCKRGGDSILRLFRWQPWAISLGYNQEIDNLNAGACARAGIDIVRRPTGGRAILHAEELTYSLVMEAGRRSILQVYNEISRALVCGLRLFGVEVTLQKSQPNFREGYQHASSIPCFTTSARYEIEWHGRKLVGSAQRRFDDGEHDVVLQHGSILCGPAHKKLAEYLNVPGEALRKSLCDELDRKTVDLAEIRGGPVEVAELADCIRRGFEKEWNIRFAPSSLPGTLAGETVDNDHRISGDAE